MANLTSTVERLRHNASQLADVLLTSDNGISENAYVRLSEMLETLLPATDYQDWQKAVDATDGRFYYKDSLPHFV